MNPDKLLWAEIHQVTRALAEHPAGFAKWCEVIRGRLLETGAVAIKLVEPEFRYCEHGISELCSECPPNGASDNTEAV